MGWFKVLNGSHLIKDKDLNQLYYIYYYKFSLILTKNKLKKNVCFFANQEHN